MAAILCAACAGAHSSRVLPHEQPTVRLDHVYVVLDSSSHAAVRADSFLATLFASVQQRTTAATDGRSWKGVYVQGRLTYVELFSPGRFGDTGSSGIGLNVAASGQGHRLRARFQEVFGDSGTIQLVTGVREGQPQPWFYSVHAPGDSADVLSRWVMEYHPSFLQWQGLDSLASDGRSWRRLLPRRQYNSERLFKDVVGATIVLPRAEITRLRQELAVYGWNVTAPGSTVVAVGPGASLRLEPATSNRTGIRELRLSLNRGVLPAQRRAIGPTTLVLSDTLATWTLF